MAESTSSGRRKGSEGEPSAAEIQEQLDRLRDDIAALTKAVTDYGQGQANAYAGRAQRKGQEFAETSQHMLDQARRDLETAEHEFEGRIRDNPLGAIAIAAGLGFLLALVTRR